MPLHARQSNVAWGAVLSMNLEDGEVNSWSVSRSKRNRKLILKIGVPLSGSGYPLIRSAPVRPRQGRDV